MGPHTGTPTSDTDGGKGNWGSHSSAVPPSVKENCQMSWAAVTKYHGLGGLNSRHLVLTVLEAGESHIRFGVW